MQNAKCPRLLAEKDLTLQAMEIAQSMEAATSPLTTKANILAFMQAY